MVDSPKLRKGFVAIMDDYEGDIGYWTGISPHEFDSIATDLIEFIHKKLTRKPTHGNCCTCQDCGQGHDECVCEALFMLGFPNKWDGIL